MAMSDCEVSPVLSALVLGETDDAIQLLCAEAPLDIPRAAQVVIETGQCESLKFLLDNYMYELDVHINILLHQALILGQEDMATLLVESGADVNYCDKTDSGNVQQSGQDGCANYSSYLPLQLSLFCSLDMIRFLLRSGADVNKRNGLKETTLISACRFSVDADLVAFLIENGANVHSYDNDRKTALHWAAWMGSTEKVTLLIDHGANLEAKDIDGQTALMYLCGKSSGHLKILLEKGASPNSKNDVRKTALHLAVETGDSVMLKLLIDHGAQLEARTSDGDTALTLACEESVPADCVRILLENGAFPNVKNGNRKSPLNIADDTRNEEKKQLLLDHGATEEQRGSAWNIIFTLNTAKTRMMAIQKLIQTNVSLNLKNHEGKAALHLAIAGGDLESMAMIVQYGADVNAMTDDNQTPLMMVCAEISVKVEHVKFLLENNALPNLTDISGNTALHMATKTGRSEKLKILVEYGASVNVKNNSEMTSLLYSCAESFIDVKCVRFLLENKALPNLKNAIGQTALHKASRVGNTEVVKLLLHNKALPNLTDQEGQTALHKASLAGNTEAVKLLLENKALPNLTDVRGDTALHVAAPNGSTEMVKLLRDYEAELETRNCNGETPFLTSVRSVRHQLIGFFHELGADMSAEDNHGQNAIIIALNKNYVRVDKTFLQGLIENGVPINHRDKKRVTPLMHAAICGHEVALTLLIEAGADVHAVSTERISKTCEIKSTALSVLLEESNQSSLGCIRELIKSGAVNSLPDSQKLDQFIHKMIQQDKRDMIHVILTNGMGPVKLRFKRRLGISVNISLLTVALRCSNMPVCRYLLGNLMLCPDDIVGQSYRYKYRRRLIFLNNTDIVRIMDEFYSQPMSLFQLSFVTVSHALGGVPGRVDRVNSLPVPSKVKDKLLFKSIDVPMDMSSSTGSS